MAKEIPKYDSLKSRNIQIDDRSAAERRFILRLIRELDVFAICKSFYYILWLFTGENGPGNNYSKCLIGGCQLGEPPQLIRILQGDISIAERRLKRPQNAAEYGVSPPEFGLLSGRSQAIRCA